MHCTFERRVLTTTVITTIVAALAYFAAEPLLQTRFEILQNQDLLLALDVRYVQQPESTADVAAQLPATGKGGVHLIVRRQTTDCFVLVQHFASLPRRQVCSRFQSTWNRLC